MAPGGGSRDGGGTEAFSGSDSGGQSLPNIAMAVWQGRLQAAMVGQLSQHSDGSGASDVPVRQGILRQRWRWGKIVQLGVGDDFFSIGCTTGGDAGDVSRQF